MSDSPLHAQVSFFEQLWTAAELRVLSIQEMNKVMVSECKIAFEALAIATSYIYVPSILLVNASTGLLLAIIMNK